VGAPSGAPSGEPSGLPTLLPAIQGYNIESSFSLAGFTASDVTDAILDGIAHVIATDLDIADSSRVVIMSFTATTLADRRVRRRLAAGVQVHRYTDILFQEPFYHAPIH
jgi:hypothetical protein